MSSADINQSVTSKVTDDTPVSSITDLRLSTVTEEKTSLQTSTREDHGILSERDFRNIGQPESPRALNDAYASDNNSSKDNNANQQNAYTEKKRSKVLSFLKTSFGTSESFTFAVCFALGVILFRCWKWAAFKGFRDNCCGMALSGQYISDECARILLGPKPPLPSRTRPTTGKVVCNAYDETLFREYILSNMDVSSPQLWRFLLFDHGVQPHTSLLWYSMVILPIRLLMISIPFLLNHETLNIDPASLLQVTGWLAIYYATGLTGIWLKLTEGIFFLLEWSFYEKHYLDLPESSWKYMTAYDTVMISTLVTMTWMLLRSDGVYFAYGAVKIRQEVLGNIMIYVMPIFGAIRLVPVVLTSGFNALALVIVKIGIYLYIVLSVNVFDEKCRASPLKKALFYLVVLVTFAAMQFADEYYTDIYTVWKREHEGDFWSRYFCRIRDEGGDLTYFKALVEEVFAREKERIIFDTAWLRKLYQHPVTGKGANPELWSRIKEYTLRVMNKDNRDLPWVMNQL